MTQNVRSGDTKLFKDHQANEDNAGKIQWISEMKIEENEHKDQGTDGIAWISQINKNSSHIHNLSAQNESKGKISA